MCNDPVSIVYHMFERLLYWSNILVPNGSDKRFYVNFEDNYLSSIEVSTTSRGITSVEWKITQLVIVSWK